jgi:hypothetical protein
VRPGRNRPRAADALDCTDELRYEFAERVVEQGLRRDALRRSVFWLDLKGGLDLAWLTHQVREARKMAKMERKRPAKQPGAGFVRRD